MTKSIIVLIKQYNSTIIQQYKVLVIIIKCKHGGDNVAWKFDNNTPIYVQIMQEVKARIAKGILKPGDKVPAVRELASLAGVNPNTMQKALSELEREGVLCSERTSGRYVSETFNSNVDLKYELSYVCIENYVKGMRSLNLSDKEMIEALEKYLKEDKDNV